MTHVKPCSSTKVKNDDSPGSGSIMCEKLCYGNRYMLVSTQFFIISVLFL